MQFITLQLSGTELGFSLIPRLHSLTSLQSHSQAPLPNFTAVSFPGFTPQLLWSHAQTFTPLHNAKDGSHGSCICRRPSFAQSYIILLNIQHNKLTTFPSGADIQKVPSGPTIGITSPIPGGMKWGHSEGFVKKYPRGAKASPSSDL